MAAMTREPPSQLLGLSLPELLELLASDARVPAGGSAAALAVAVAAGLAGKAARLSRPAWTEAGGAIAQADALRTRATMLAEDDAVAFEEALTVLDARGEPGPHSDAAMRDALLRAAEVPLAISRVACDVALLAAAVAETGDPEVSADAAVAALLAEGAARSARHLVAVNLTTLPGDVRAAGGDQLVEAAAAAAKRALAVVS